MISKDEIVRVSQLAHLRFQDAELDKFLTEFSQILEYFETLNQLDTSGVEPTRHATVVTTTDPDDYRADQTRESLHRDEALGQAPEKRQGHFVVPKVIT